MAGWIERWKRLPRVLRISGAVLLLVLGVLGLFLPVLQGILFLAAGLALLAADVPAARCLLDRIRARVATPRTAKRSDWIPVEQPPPPPSPRPPAT